MSSPNYTIQSRIRLLSFHNVLGNITYKIMCQVDQTVITHTHTQPFYGPFSGTTRVSRCQKRTSGLYSTREN